MSQPTEVYASPGGTWRVYSYYNGGAYLITHRVRGTKLMSVHLQGDDAVQFEREFMDEDGYPIEGRVAGRVAGMPRALLALQEYSQIMTEDEEDNYGG